MARSELQREPVLQGETEVGTDGSHQRGRHDVLPDCGHKGVCRPVPETRVVHRLAPAVQRGDGNRHVPDGSRETCGMVFAGQVEGMECHDEGCTELYV